MSPIALVASAVCLAAGVAAKPIPIVERPSAQTEAYAAEVLGVGDVTSIDGKVAETLLDADDMEITRSVRVWVQKTKLHFGEVKDTPADQLCVKKWLAEQMKGANMRDKDARGLIPTVAFMSTVPDIDDVLANFLRNSGVVSVMHVLGGGRRGA